MSHAQNGLEFSSPPPPPPSFLRSLITRFRPENNRGIFLIDLHDVNLMSAKNGGEGGGGEKEGRREEGGNLRLE